MFCARLCLDIGLNGPIMFVGLIGMAKVLNILPWKITFYDAYRHLLNLDDIFLLYRRKLQIKLWFSGKIDTHSKHVSILNLPTRLRTVVMTINYIDECIPCA